jgi:hypothetical protein
VGDGCIVSNDVDYVELNLALQWHLWVSQVHGSNHGDTMCC